MTFWDLLNLSPKIKDVDISFRKEKPFWFLAEISEVRLTLSCDRVTLLELGTVSTG